AGISGVTTAQIYPQSAKPAPAIILGEVNDFKNLKPSEDSQIPKASIDIPEGEIQNESGFEVDANLNIADSKTVTLESHSEGETISTQDPEFFGKGPIGTEIEIQVESELQSDTITVGNSGDWTWSPPEGLEEGTHTVTIKWKDINGILRTLTRNFVVSASESPAFVSTPSATPKLTSSPSATPKATTTASASATPQQPVSGSLTQTLLLFMIGIATISFGFILWKQSEI
ncbi:MAG: Ig-like domain-containing protein, partial [Patescibacteria group bacterium]